jgi:dihydroneopterin aldolase
MVIVHLHNLAFHAFHGVYSEEHKTGNNYELNLDVMYEERNSQFETINDTISYEDLFGIIKRRMQVPTPLLEKVCEGIIRKIKHEYPNVREIVVSLYKLQPPIENLQGKVGVTMRKIFND